VGSGQSDSHVARYKQHDGQACRAYFGQELGMPGKWNARVVDHVLRERRGDKGRKTTVATSLHGQSQAVEQATCIRRIGFAACDIGGEGYVQDCQGAACRLPRVRLTARQAVDLNADVELLRALAHEPDVGDHNEVRIILRRGNGQAKFRTDARRFPGGDYQRFAVAGHIRMST
jgi:hypothetical protein